MDALNGDISGVVLGLHTAATAFMVGLIWFVQVVHYPLFSRVGAGQFPVYAREHQVRTTLVVMPPMLVELGTAALLPTLPETRGALAWAGLGMVGAIWVSTFAVQVPLHARLGRGYDERAQRRLVATNWVRTVLWTARLPVALLMMGAGA